MDDLVIVSKGALRLDGSAVISARKDTVDKVFVEEDVLPLAHDDTTIDAAKNGHTGVNGDSAAAASPVENDLVGKDADTANVYQTEHVRIVIDPARDAKLTAFGMGTLEDRYLLPEEAGAPQKLFARVAAHYGDDGLSRRDVETRL